MARRRTAEHPTFGTVWVAAIEDLILAKLMWSEGTSELQLRDCAILMRINRDEIGLDLHEALGSGPRRGRTPGTGAACALTRDERRRRR